MSGSNRSLCFRRIAIVLAVVGYAVLPAAAQAPWPAVDAAELRRALERLQVVGSALYVAAHPDDENTALLAYLSQGRRLRTGYLSLTRGDGGQNLIGSEQGAALGVIRTHELAAARRLDGGEQLFTRAIDFGYTKSVDETLEVWDREAVLADVVRVVRAFRPDVMITRFPPDERAGHGQHTASAVLALEAFHAAADPERFPEQLEELDPWQPRRIYWNSWQAASEDPAGVIEVDVGAYDPLLGRSYAEIAALSRSQHKSQGFGATPQRGSQPARLELLAGDPAADPFAGIDLTWGRLAGGETVGRHVEEALAAFDPERPAAVIPPLVAALERLRALPHGPWRAFKERQLLEAVRAAAGLWLEAVSETPAVTPGGRLAVTATALNRSPAALRLTAVELPFAAAPEIPAAELAANRPHTLEAELAIPAGQPLTRPYWLRQPAANGLYRVDDPSLVGLPEAPPPLTARFRVEIAGQELVYEVPVLYRWTDPVAGERYRPVEIVPPVTVTPRQGVVIYPDEAPRRLEVALRAGTAAAEGEVRLELPAGFHAAPAAVAFSLGRPGEEQTVAFEVTPPQDPVTATLRAVATVGGARYDAAIVPIDHPHVPPQTLFPPAEAKLVRLDLALPAEGFAVGYVMGAGDDVPEVLRQLGMEVALLSDAELATTDLGRFDAVVLGVRAYNTREALARLNERLLAYVDGGGTLVAQYNTAHALVLEAFAPYPLELSRGRVSREGAPVTLLAPDDPLLTAPNRITAADFEGWVQERGLYFPGTWDERYRALLAAADPGEEPLAGGLLAASYGDGAWIYTGYSFFRQLPAGVPGALRLFVNLLAAPGGGD